MLYVKVGVDFTLHSGEEIPISSKQAFVSQKKSENYFTIIQLRKMGTALMRFCEIKRYSIFKAASEQVLKSLAFIRPDTCKFSSYAA